MNVLSGISIGFIGYTIFVILDTIIKTVVLFAEGLFEGESQVV